MNTALWRLRGTLKDAGTDPDRWIEQDSETLALVDDGGPVVDLGAFRQIVGAAQLPVTADSGALLQLYGGEFAAGLDAEWVEVERRKLHQQFTDLLRRAAETWSAAHRLRDAMALAEALVQDDPLDEDARRMLLRLQIDSGNRGKALREFTELENVLQSELGVAPSERTRAIFIDGTSEVVADGERSYRIEPDEAAKTQVDGPGFRIESTAPAEELSLKIAELKATAERLLSGLTTLERML